MKSRYGVRALKYFLWLIVLLAAVILFLSLAGLSRVGFEQTVAELFTSVRGWFMFGLIVLLAATYPRFGFVKTEFKADMAADRDKIVKAFDASGFLPVEESTGRMVFRARTPLKRALLLWEDAITVSPEGKGISVEGVRKEVVRADYKLRAFLQEE